MTPSRKILLAAATAALVCILNAQDKQLVSPTGVGKKKALVIGNSAYPSAFLPNPVHDAADMRTALRAKGFSVMDCCDNLDAVGLDRTITEWSGQLQHNDIAIFYYSGHGMRVDGVDFLVPVDFSPTYDQTDVRFRAYPLERLQGKMTDRGTRVNVIFIDACRDNPFALTKSLGKGLATTPASIGTMIFYAASEGKTADDNNGGRNSLFTEILLQELEQKSVTLRSLDADVKVKVYESSHHSQLPYVADGTVYDLSLDTAKPTSEISNTEHSPAAPTDVPSKAIDVSEAKPAAINARAEPPIHMFRINCADLTQRTGVYLYDKPQVLDLKDVVTTATCGSAVSVVGKSDDSTWYEIRSSDGSGGWLQARYVVSDGHTGTAGNTNATTPASSPSYVSCLALDRRGDLFLYESPDVLSNVAGKIACTAHVTVIEKGSGGDWYHIRTDSGMTGWLQSRYLTL